MKIFKKLDFVIIVFLLILSFVPQFIFMRTLSKDYNSTYASIKIRGNHYADIPLSNSNEDDIFVLETPFGNNTISINDGCIQILEADCHDELCVKHRSISRPGESIICLPHELVIEIKGESNSSYDDMILPQ